MSYSTKWACNKNVQLALSWNGWLCMYAPTAPASNAHSRPDRRPEGWYPAAGLVGSSLRRKTGMLTSKLLVIVENINDSLPIHSSHLSSFLRRQLLKEQEWMLFNSSQNIRKMRLFHCYNYHIIASFFTTHAAAKVIHCFQVKVITG